MRKLTTSLILILAFTLSLLSIENSFSQGLGIVESDTADRQLVGFFDLRDRESFIQITNSDTVGQIVHIQLFNVADNCNENNFNDAYTPNDTHVYNLREVTTNDGNDSGVVLPAGAYGIFVATYVSVGNELPIALIGNLRIIDDNGYEYRTNLLGTLRDRVQVIFDPLTFNFNDNSGVTLSDVVGIALSNLNIFEPPAEVFAADVLDIWISFDVDILNNNENIFSCRDITFACVNQEHPLLEELLEESETSVASLEYGINNAIPHSKGGELLCPGNTISEGIVTLDFISFGDRTDATFFIFVGLNNGNGRGSFDAVWNDNRRITF